MLTKAKYGGRCKKCAGQYLPGSYIDWTPGTSGALCSNCANNAPFQKPEEKPITELPSLVELKDRVKQAVDAFVPGFSTPILQNQADLFFQDIQARVDARIQEEVKSQKAPVHVIDVLLSGDKGEGELKRIEGAHFLMPRLLKLLDAGIPLYLWGPAGSGKSTAIMQAAEILKQPFEVDTLDPTTFRSMVQGFCNTQGAPVHTSFSRLWETGGVYIAEELDAAPSNVQTLFNSGLANDRTAFPWGNTPKSSKFRFAGNGNTPGAPTREFPDRKMMASAFKDRLYFMYWPIDPAIEAKMAGIKVPPVPTRQEHTVTPQTWTKFVIKLREWASVNAPTLMVSPRASHQGIKCLALGETPDEIADGLIFRGADAELRAKALSQVHWNTVDQSGAF